MKWKKSTFTIAVNPHCYQPEEPIKTGFVSDYFGIHKTGSGWYSITHLVSGMRAAEVKKLSGAKQLAAELLPLADWSLASPLRVITEEARLLIRAKVQAAQ